LALTLWTGARRAFMPPRYRRSLPPSIRVGAMILLVQRAMLGATVSLAACLAAAQAPAGDSTAPIAPSNARCRSHGDGFIGVAGSDACIRISGYIDAGADFSTSRGGRDAPLLAPANPALRTGAAAALDSRFDTSMGPARVYIEIGRPRFGP
jgi:hypothetical protein